jgi:hypothetical protein
MSAVSGGSYALSWFFLQHYYHRDLASGSGAALEQVQKALFDADGPFQTYLAQNAKSLGASTRLDHSLGATFDLLYGFTAFNALRLLQLPLPGVANRTAQANATSMIRQSYREGLQQTYQFFPDPERRAPVEHPTFNQSVFIRQHFLGLTARGVPPVSFPAMSAFAERVKLPSFVFNTTVVPPRAAPGVNLRGRVFELGAKGFGSGSCGYSAWEDTEGLGWEPGAPVDEHWFRKGFSLERTRRGGVVSPYATIRNFNVAPAISGAALSGTNPEGWRARLALSLGNVGLEYLAPKPGDPRRTVRLGDGGHSENLGAFALLRRRCRTILIVDAEHDPEYKFDAYRKLQKAAEEELKTKIELPALDQADPSGVPKIVPEPLMKGAFAIEGNPSGKIHYLKLAIPSQLRDEEAKIINAYWSGHERFPQESTLDQYFSPARFAAYRALGYAIARTLDGGIADS